MIIDLLEDYLCMMNKQSDLFRSCRSYKQKKCKKINKLVLGCGLRFCIRPTGKIERSFLILTVISVNFTTSFFSDHFDFINYQLQMICKSTLKKFTERIQRGMIDKIFIYPLIYSFDFRPNYTKKTVMSSMTKRRVYTSMLIGDKFL